MEIHCETSLLALLEARSRAAAPAEACGLIAGTRAATGWRLTEFVEMTNRSQQHGAFAIDAVELLQATLKIEAEGKQLCALFHSHLGGDPCLSAKDLHGAWPELIQLICAPGNRPAVQFAAWRVNRGEVTKLHLVEAGR